MRFLKVSELYTYFIDQLYDENTELRNLPYEKQRNFILNQKFAWSDFWPVHLNKKPGFYADEILGNVERLQRKWAIENAPDLNENISLEKILFRQIISYNPEILFIENQNLSSSFIIELRQQLPKLRYVFGIDGIHRCAIDKFNNFDLVLVTLPETKTFYNSLGLPSLVFRLGFEKSILDVIKNTSTEENKERIPLGFVGSILPGKHTHNFRRQFLKKMSQKFLVHLNLSGTEKIPKNAFIYLIGGVYRRKFNERRSSLFFGKRNKGTKFGLSMYRTLSRTDVSLNCHIDIAGDNAVNMRLFEATGVGSCLLTDYKPGIEKLFEPDFEIVTYSSIPEAIEKAKYLIDHPEEAKKIARKGQERTLRDYTLEKTIDSVMQYVFKRI